MAGTLGDEAALLNALRRMFDLNQRMEQLFTYASCRRDEDNANPTYQRLSDMAMHTYQEFMQAAAFVEPELLSLDESYIKAVMDKPAFKDYRVSLKSRVMHMRPHTLSRELIETLIASTSEMKGAPDAIYSMMTDADMTFPTIKDDNGSDIRDRARQHSFRCWRARTAMYTGGRRRGTGLC